MSKPSSSPSKPEIVLLSRKSLTPSPENRPERSGFSEKSITELAISFKGRGILQPLVVRPHPNGKGHEIVAGERRWTAAGLEGVSKAAIKEHGLTEIDPVPCIVKQRTDSEAREDRLIENAQREGVHALEEAKAYQSLLDEEEEGSDERTGKEKAYVTSRIPKKKYTFDSLAAKLGKSPTWVRARVKLLNLPEFAQEAMFIGNGGEPKLNASVALLLCRIPDPKLAQKAACEVLDPLGTGPANEERIKRALDPEIEAMSYRKAKDHIRLKYMVRLKDAPFDQEDATLGDPPMACSKCPHRTGNMKALFADVESADVCTNPTCFAKKKDQTFKREQEKFAKKGQTLLSPTKATAVLDLEGEVSFSARSRYLPLREPCPGKKGKTWEDVLEKHLPEEAQIVVARGKKTHLLLPMADALKAAEAAGVQIKKPQSALGYAPPSPEEQKKIEEQRLAKRQATGKVLETAYHQLVDNIA